MLVPKQKNKRLHVVKILFFFVLNIHYMRYIEGNAAAKITSTIVRVTEDTILHSKVVINASKDTDVSLLVNAGNSVFYKDYKTK